MSGVAVDEDHLLVADYENFSILVFSRSDGAHVLCFGSKGSGNSQFNTPQGVALDGKHLYIADLVNN